MNTNIISVPADLRLLKLQRPLSATISPEKQCGYIIYAYQKKIIYDYSIDL
jgi:hypothetical protein